MKKLSNNMQTMTPEVEELVQHLNTTVSSWDMFNNILDDGYVLVASVISKNLTKYKIPYTIKLYFHKNLNGYSLDEILEKEELVHMSIDIFGNEIGGSIEDVYSKQYSLTCKITKLTPEQLDEIYQKYTWNGAWDKNNNKDFEQDIDMVFKMIL